MKQMMPYEYGVPERFLIIDLGGYRKLSIKEKCLWQD